MGDFGLATKLRGGLKTFCGTAEYVAPEMLMQDSWEANTLDWWALGITLYQMLSGRTPFGAPNAESVFLNILTMPLSFGGDVERCFCDASRDLIAGLLAKKPEDRLTGAAVRGHAFFAGTDWDAMLRRELPPPIARADFPVVEGLDGLDVMLGGGGGS